MRSNLAISIDSMFFLKEDIYVNTIVMKDSNNFIPLIKDCIHKKKIIIFLTMPCIDYALTILSYQWFSEIAELVLC